MQQDVNIRGTKVTHKILTANPLAPIATSATTEAISKPKRLIIVPGRTTRTLAVVSILVEETTTLGGALGGTFAVGVCVDINARRRALEEVLVTNSPTYNIDLDVGVREVVEAVQPLEPFLILLVGDSGNLGPLSLCYGSAGLPADANVD
jgi:hypothetical protein